MRQVLTTEIIPGVSDYPLGKAGRGASTRCCSTSPSRFYEDIVLPEARTMRNEWIGPQLQKIMQSGKVRESGLLSSKRGGFFLADIDAPEELYELFGPEFYDTCRVDAQPVTSIEKAGEMFERWASEGR